MDVDLAGVFDDEDFQEEGLNGKVIILNTTAYNVWFYNIVWGNPSKKCGKFHTCGGGSGSGLFPHFLAILDHVCFNNVWSDPSV